jgi:hypothetical protein
MPFTVISGIFYSSDDLDRFAGFARLSAPAPNPRLPYYNLFQNLHFTKNVILSEA